MILVLENEFVYCNLPPTNRLYFSTVIRVFTLLTYYR